MSDRDPKCWFNYELERWANCDGHWRCYCPIVEDSQVIDTKEKPSEKVPTTEEQSRK